MKRISLCIALFTLAQWLCAQTYLTQDFENGMGQWQAITMNTQNSSAYGIQTGSAHSGNAYFKFSSYYSASDYNQYLISPQLNLSNEARLDYYYKDISDHGNETFTLMVSTTDSQISSFTAIGDTITAASSWTKGTYTLPANTKYVAFHYTSNYQYDMGLDDISISVLSPTPEVALQQIIMPQSTFPGEDFTVQGVVVNNSTVPLTTLDIDCIADGVITSETLHGLSVAEGTAYTFTFSTPIHLTTGGFQPVQVVISNPNGQSDNTTDNTLTDTILVCEGIQTLPYFYGFEQGIACWQGFSASTANNVGISTNNYHNGTHSFLFSSWYTSSDYSQYLISPELELSAPAGFSFFAKDIWGNGGETIQVMYSTTDDEVSSFVNLGEQIDVHTSWHEHILLLPANAKYVMIKYTSLNRCYTCIDDISIFEVPVEPEFELTNVQAPYMVAANRPFEIEGTLVNHSSTAITSFTVSYTIEDNTTTDEITGVEALYNEPFTFTIPTPATISEVGQHTVTVTIQNPNGVTDNLTDNTLTTTVEAYNAVVTVPRKVLMEHFSTSSCPNCIDGHTRIEEAVSNGHEDDIIWVTHHTGYMSDRLTLDEDDTFKNFYNGATYAPAVMLDRTYFGEFSWTHGIGVPPGPVFCPYTGFEDGLETALSIPAHITVSIENLNYDPASRQLSVTVSGEAVSELDAIDPRLNVWLMEDGLLADGDTMPGHGPTQSHAPEGFTHDHVVRMLLSTSAWGDANIVSTSAGSVYSNTYSCTVPTKYIDSMCYIVAFVSEGDHSDYNNCRVYNAEKSWRLTGSASDDLNQYAEVDKLVVYPNPAHTSVRVRGLQGATCPYALFAMTGQCVKEGVTTDEIEVSGLRPGIYVLELKTPQGLQRTKIVVE